MMGLGHGLREGGHEVVICCHEYEPGSMQPDPAESFEIRAVHTGEIRVPRTRAESLRFSWRAMRDLAKLVPADADTVNAHESPAHIAGHYARRRVDTPVVWTRNDYTVYEAALMPEETWLPAIGVAGRVARRVAGLPDRQAGRAMDAIAVLDSRNARMVERAYGHKAEIICSGAAEKFFDAPARGEARRALGIADDEVFVLGLGILAPYRRFEDLIDAIGELGDIDRLRARVIGSDHSYPQYGHDLSARIARLGLEDHVELVREAVSDDDLVANYAAADVFVFPNEKQTWGLAPLEAIAAGTPVVVSRGAGVHEVLEGRPGVEVVAVRSPQAIATAVRAQLTASGRAGLDDTREWVRAEFGKQAYAAKMAALFAGLQTGSKS